MATRLSPDPELVPLIRAIRARIDAVGTFSQATKDGIEVYARGETTFLQMEVRRDHVLMDLWLDADGLEEARASGIARAHPFMGDEAVRVRFERATDLTRVARWLESSHRYADARTKAAKRRERSGKTAPAIKEGTKDLVSAGPSPAGNGALSSSLPRPTGRPGEANLDAERTSSSADGTTPSTAPTLVPRAAADSKEEKKRSRSGEKSTQKAAGPSRSKKGAPPAKTAGAGSKTKSAPAPQKKTGKAPKKSVAAKSASKTKSAPSKGAASKAKASKKTSR